MCDSAGIDTKTIIEAGEIIQTITPARLGTLYFYVNGDYDKQIDIAERMGCSPSTVTIHMQALSNLSIPVVQEDPKWILTSEGDEIVGAVCRTLKYFDDRFEDIQWDDSEERSAMKRFFEPLQKSRTSMIFFVLVSIGLRNSASNQIDLMEISPTSTNDIYDDVEKHQKGRGKSLEQYQLRSRLESLEEADSVGFENENVILREKGQHQIELLNYIIQIIEGDNDADFNSLEPNQNTKTVAIDGDMTVDDLIEQLMEIRDEHGGDATIRMNWRISVESKPNMKFKKNN